MLGRRLFGDRLRFAIAAGCVLGTLLLLWSSGATPAGAQKQQAKAPLVTPRGAGGLRLGMTVRALHKRHLIGYLKPGCELDVGQRVARLRAPLNGFAVFSHPNNRVRSIVVRGRAKTARHVGVGSRPATVLSAYPNATYEPPGTALPFAEGFIWINQIPHPQLTFTVDPDTHLVTAISVPSPNFCE